MSHQMKLDLFCGMRELREGVLAESTPTYGYFKRDDDEPVELGIPYF